MYMAEVLFLIFLICFVVVTIVSQVKQIPIIDAICVCLEYLNGGKKEGQMVRFPTCIGSGCNGAFVMADAEKGFDELNKIFDGLYLSGYQELYDRYVYYFKFARVLCEMEPSKLYEYTDRKVSSIVNKFVTRVSSLGEIENVSSIQIENGNITIYVAKTPEGQIWNKDWYIKQYNALKEVENSNKGNSVPIRIGWDDLQK